VATAFHYNKEDIASFNDGVAIIQDTNIMALYSAASEFTDQGPVYKWLMVNAPQVSITVASATGDSVCGTISTQEWFGYQNFTATSTMYPWHLSETPDQTAGSVQDFQGIKLATLFGVSVAPLFLHTNTPYNVINTFLYSVIYQKRQDTKPHNTILKPPLSCSNNTLPGLYKYCHQWHLTKLSRYTISILGVQSRLMLSAWSLLHHDRHPSVHVCIILLQIFRQAIASAMQRNTLPSRLSVNTMVEQHLLCLKSASLAFLGGTNHRNTAKKRIQLYALGKASSEASFNKTRHKKHVLHGSSRLYTTVCSRE
jgi:hypothetical protein